jgi:hypothetical protein
MTGPVYAHRQVPSYSCKVLRVLTLHLDAICTVPQIYHDQIDSRQVCRTHMTLFRSWLPTITTTMPTE